MCIQLTYILSRTSSSRYNRIQKVLNADVIMHYLRLDTIDLALLFLYFLFDFSQLVLERMEHLFSDSLLFLKFRLA